MGLAFPVATETCFAARSWTGVEATFVPGFSAQQTSDVLVYSQDPATFVQTLLTMGVHYSVALGPSDGAVTVTPIALPAAPKTILIVRNTPATQAVDFQNLGSYSPAVHTEGLSKAALRDAEDKLHRGRMLRAPLGEALAVDLPNATARANKLLGFDGAGNPVAQPAVSPALATGVAVTPAGGISSTNVQAALAELDTEKASIANLSSLAFSGAVADLVGPLAHHNLVIGGDFTVNPWQRGTAFTAIASPNYYTDRWTYRVNATTAVIDLFKTADAPTIAQAGVFTQHCLHLDVTTAQAVIGAGDSASMQTRVEGASTSPLGFGQAGALSMLVSFWVKATKTGIYCVSARNGTNLRSYIKEFTVNASDVWEKKLFVIPGDTAGTWLYDSGTGLILNWCLASGTNFMGAADTWLAGTFIATANQVNGLDSAANNFKLALVKAEMGGVDRGWLGLPAATVLAQCQRYYRKSFQMATAPAQNVASLLGAHFAMSHVAAATFGSRVQFERMRATPTITTYNPSAANANWRDATNGADRVATVSDISEIGFNVTGGAGAAAALNYIHYQAAAEL